MTEVRIATLAEILPLRHAVLRPGEPESAARWSGDAEAVHVAAFDAGVLVGCASIGPDGWPGDLDPAAPPADPAAWRLRGMAVAPAARGRGVGAQVLDLAVAAAGGAGARLLWANARVSALGFYLRAGWQVVGAEFVTPATGLPHRRIVRPAPL